MRPILLPWLVGALIATVSFAGRATSATKDHVITFGKWILVPWLPASAGDNKPRALKIRALTVDGRVKEYVLGAPHEVTDRLFVVRRAFRVNDSLPGESSPHWLWLRGGWLVVDRATGRISPINLPQFDSSYSVASWYRDYATYCGVSDDGKKILAVVAQLGRRRPVLSKPLSNDGVPDDAPPDSACPAPAWQRGPVRVTFEPAGGAKQTFVIHGHLVDGFSNDENEEEPK